MYRNNQEDALAVRSSGFVSAKCVMGRGIESRRLGYFKKKRRLINTPETLSINALVIGKEEDSFIFQKLFLICEFKECSSLGWLKCLEQSAAEIGS
jgi:hypothetical protein